MDGKFRQIILMEFESILTQGQLKAAEVLDAMTTYDGCLSKLILEIMLKINVNMKSGKMTENQKYTMMKISENSKI